MWHGPHSKVVLFQESMACRRDKFEVLRCSRRKEETLPFVPTLLDEAEERVPVYLTNENEVSLLKRVIFIL